MDKNKILSWPVGFLGLEARRTLSPCVRISFCKRNLHEQRDHPLEPIAYLGLLDVEFVTVLTVTKMR